MTDRGEKIVSLAKEMLSAHAENPGFSIRASQPSPFGIKAVCAALVIGAMAAAPLTHIIDEHFRPANRYERVEIEALLFYAARERAFDPQFLRDQLSFQLDIPSLESMTRADYEAARLFLLSRIP